MEIIEIKKDLFLDRVSLPIIHCISSDFALGAGFAKILDGKVGVRDVLVEKNPRYVERFNQGDGQMIYARDVYNLITKKYYYQKPTYKSMEKSLLEFRKYIEEDLSYNRRFKMPKIGCGLDKLEWGKVKNMLECILGDLDIILYVYYI